MWTLGIFVCVGFLADTVFTTTATPPDNKGLEFVLMFMENEKLGSQVFPLELYCTTQETKPVHVHITSPKWNNPKVDKSFTVTDGQVKKTLIDVVFRMTGSSVSSKALLVQADAEIACYGANKETLSNDVYLGLPVDALGTDYYAMAFSPASIKTELGIASTEDGTSVKVTLPSGNGPLDIVFKGKTYHAGDVITVPLGKYDTLQLQSTGDLTGAHIETNKPVAAFSGNVKTNVGNGTFQDHLVEQLVPSDRWGQKFVTAPIPGRTVGDVFKVIAREDNTVINVPGQAPIHLNKGGVARFELTSDKYNYITSTKPIMLAQFVKSQQKPTEPADPSMMIIPPYEQFGSDYTFTTPEYSHPEYGTDPTFRYKNEFMIVTKKSDIQGLLLDGKPFPKTTWTDIPGTDLVGSYVTLPHGPHTVRHSNPLSTFGGYLYGHAYHESYGFPTGMRTAIIYSANCTPTASVPGDGIDNDCDNKIDEELCPDNIDDDGDGKEDEDCVKTFPIDGLWGDWSPWSSQCSVTCGDGVLTRARKCDSPAPKFGGKNCTGNDQQTKSCYGGQPCGIDIAAVCAANAGSVVPNPLNCAQYYDCAKKSNLGQLHLFECPYPQLFNNITMKCDDFEHVDCGRRNEPMAPCEYEQNKCNGSDPNCKPCTQRLYSCVGVDDGRQPQSVFAPEYKDCKKNRTLGQGKCDFGYFNPQAHRCMPHNPGTLSFFCRQHKSDKLGIPDNCAKFYNCAKTGNTLADKTDECNYPDLFSVDTGQCENFTTVQCKNRMEPQAPCEYDQNKCPPTNTTCKCPDEHADCRGQADGLEPWKGKMWGPKYAKCFKNRTLSQDTCPRGQYFHPMQKKCTDTVKPTEVKDVCQANPNMVFPDDQNCAKYIDCSARTSQLGNYVMECKYPQLFSTKTGKCENFETVQCDKRVEPQAPCDYEQNMCAKRNTSCSCPDNLPSCVGKTDGDHAFPTRMWKPDYVKCYKNRTILPTKRCTKGYFHPVQNKCMEDVPKPDAHSYCKANPNDVITMPDNCAQYINCSIVVTLATTSDPVQECKYPDLFSTQTMSCQAFTTVNCNKRMEPQAPCEYKQNVCAKGNTTCQRCVDRLPSCVGVTDGDTAFSTRMWKPDYVTCTKNRTVLPTKKCTKADALPYCQANPTAVVQIADNCAQYINCSVVRSGGSAADPIQECKYPDLFSTISMTCQDFTTVQCKNRTEPKAPCEYKQNLCDPADARCIPCQDRLPSCVGKNDGDQAFTTRLWKPDYVKCNKDRTVLPTKKCTKGYFHPIQKQCVEDVTRPDAKSYCQSNPNDVIPLPDNCAQYIDCTVVMGGTSSADPVKECTYPDLFSTLSMTCQHFTTVSCDKRMEPQAPCDYDQNKCAQGNTTCVCPENLPSCVGKTDGDHAFPSRMWKPDYITCYKNRTILPTKKCTKGYFHPVQEKCEEDVLRPDAKQYCQQNPNDVIPMADNCARYVNCTAVSMGTGSDPVQECTYPDLFSRQTQTCRNFVTVNCDKRREPMAPCEYDQNLCVNLKTTGCTTCPDRLPSCIGKADGNQPFPSKLWSKHFIHCFKNRTVVDQCPSGAVFDPNTRSCTSRINRANIDSYCSAYPTAIKVNPLNCAQYYNCSDNSASLGHHLHECIYPDVFSDVTQKCEQFESVQCTNRSEPKAPCEYMQNLCPQSDPTCVRCPDRLPSCVGMSDGNHAFPSRTWKPDYITCYKNRTVNVTRCSTGYFHPVKEMCTNEVTKPDAKPYCQSNHNDVVPLPDNCAHFLDCTLYINGNVADPVQECHYPDLFSTTTMKCEKFEVTTCDKRKEPMAPCEYEKNQCPTNDPACVPCQDRLPSCVAVADGANAFPNKLWKQNYITCYKNRTVLPVNQCRNGYFHPIQRQCANDVSKVDAKPYCQANPNDVVPLSNNCAHFIDCAAVLASPASDPVSECTYPDLFSTISMVCESFTTVTCDLRPEPQAPCEYDQNICSPGNTSCELCPERLPSCIGLADGAQPFPTKLWTSNYVQCYRNRTVAITKCPPPNVFDPVNQACVTHVPNGRMDSYCKVNPGIIKVDTDNCAQYFNCSNPASTLGHYKQECKYPDLFSSITLTCQQYNTVNCQTRPEPKAPCDYEQNLCQPNDTTCEPCPNRLPTCVGKTDGNHAFLSRLWKKDYIVCTNERTVAEKQCQQGYFHPALEVCTEKVQPTDAKPYCTANPQAVVPAEDNCAHLINCTAYTSGARADPVMECPYPQLFSTSSMACQDFTTVTCGNRTEPQAPCEYEQNRCSPNDQTCVDCQDRLPSCKGLSDGDHAFPTRLWKPQYITCYRNRTQIPTKKCFKGYFHPTKRVCTEKIDTPDAVQYCQANPGDMLPVETNCAKYYKCSAPLVGQDVVQECRYPDLFSTISMTCQDFTTVHCDKRPEPQAPCEYDQNQCPSGQTCEPCPDRLPSCVGLPDGDQPAAGHRWKDLYVRCYKNRTTEVKHCPNGSVFDPNRLACASKIKSGDITSFCQANPLAIKPHDTNCAQYYNCSNPSSSIGSYLQECKYPDLFSSVTLLCEKFESVPCGSRHEPMPPCEYLQNLCDGSDPSCVPCQDRLPSCVGLPDGDNAIQGKEWQADYVECNKNRTVSVTHCQIGYFHPVTRTCTEQVKRADVKNFCTSNPTAIVEAQDDCAQYFNCSQRASAIGDFVGECKYPSLFSTFTMTCGSFRRTFCDARPEPQAPCQYEQNRCLQSDPNCIPCEERLPSCIGLPDRAQPHPSHLWGEKYVECFSNRTMAVRTCPSGYFHPRQHQCRSKVDPVDVPEYCQSHVTDVITNRDNCAVYYNCSSPDTGHMTECQYPDLYDASLKMCRDFSQVVCDTRPEPKAPCQYKQNVCQTNDTSCIPCQDRLPSCVGLPDGSNPVPSQQWGPKYITCFKNRTTDVTRCKTGFFHPKLRTCASVIEKPDLGDYCNKHPEAIIPYPDNCAQYVNCSEVTGQTVRIKECTYPDLFSADTMTCTRFTRVLCDKRPEPQAPCEYDQNKCAQGDTSCTPCSQRLPSCIGSPDGARPFKGLEWTENYIECFKNRTMALDKCPIGSTFDSFDFACTSNKNAIQSFCRFNSQVVQEHPDNCAQYFNCSVPGSPLGPYLMECDYPKLFSAQLKSCVNFESAQCGSKKEPERPCDYLNNLCAPQDFSCTPCQSRLPSCVGLSDGFQQYPSRTWQADYMNCYKNRTISVEKCPRGYFHPQQRACVDVINQVNIVSYCQVHTTDIVSDPNSCSNYFNCSDTSSALGPYQSECKYPDLYSPAVRACMYFDSVDCGKRPEPVSPCDYTHNLCDPSDTLCTPCTKRFPSCKGLPDDKNPSPGPLWAQGYIVCEKGRTLSVEKCTQGQHFNPRTKSCETHIAPVDIVQYCQANTRAVVPKADTCSQYYDCPHVLVTSGEVSECTYPDLFSTISLKCEPFETVDCESRQEPQAPCEYSKNLCPASDTNCVPCPARLPSCVGFPDGSQMFGSQQWSTQYVDCYKNRTVAINQCPQESFFNPTSRRCTQNINQVDIISFCHAYPTAVRPHPTNCAQYYDCSTAAFGGSQNRECPYPQLFDAVTLTCKPFTDVQCGVRYEPKAPCEYQANQCSPGQQSCEPCTSRKPSCVGLDDGNQPFPGRLWQQQFIVCNKNRTTSVSRCPGTSVFNPNTKQCVEIQNITKFEIIDYCKAYPNAVLPDPDDCSRYYQCRLVTSSATSSHQQCTYPDLFSPFQSRCVQFDAVQCGNRPELTAPCQYDHNKCLQTDSTCIPCQIRLPDCTGLPDGDDGIPGMLWSVNYVRCQTNRTLEVKRCAQGVFDPNSRACSVHVGPQYINEMCFSNPRAIVPHPTNCAQYFDCSRDNTQFGHYLMECDYPMLFDEQSLQCRNFFDVNCGKKFEPKAPCQYFQNICPAGNTSCTPCADRKPSCVGQPDGNNAVPGKAWSQDFMTCSKDRTLSTPTCPVGQFDPSKRSCISTINPVDIPSYCQSNPTAVLPDMSNCGHYFNCSDPSNGYKHECTYPRLFSDKKSSCEDFQSVFCGRRPEPQTLCEYSSNQCRFGDSSCVPCQDKLPSCKGLPDGINPVPGKLWTDLYIQCLKNRTLVVEHCKVGIFDPTVKKCIENVDPSKINQVCQANHDAVFSDPTNCAKYYDCKKAPGFGFGVYYQEECPYPELFSAVSKSCQNFTTVICSSRREPQAPCEYTQNQCKSSFNCQPCSERLPNCVGAPDGPKSVPRHQWTSDYVICYKNRTFNLTRCSASLIFDPISRKCAKYVEPAHVPDYCKVNSRAVFPNTQDAAQYYDCSNPSSPVGVPYLQECNYPDLFDTLTLSCRDFTTVPTDQRPVPQAPCEYQRNNCSPKSSGCTPCSQRLYSCVGLPDGPNAIEGKLWTADYIKCRQNRTMGTSTCNQGVFDPNKRQCEIQPTSGPATIQDQCRLDPSRIIPYPGSCSLYYNCSKSVATFGPILPVQLDECEYPDLYSTVYQKCLDFQYAQCDNRHEVKAPCQYLQNQCNPNDVSCSPCPERLPSCIGLQDGNNAITGRYWSRDYVYCYKERTLGVEQCQNGVFNPNSRRCDNGVDKGNIDDYCRSHPNELIADSKNCAKFFDCSKPAFRIGVAMPGDSYLSMECQYPDMFSTVTKKCEPFNRVTCDKRKEPQAPCEYSQNLCRPGDSTCVPCNTRLPSCVGLPDGHVAVPGREYSDTYLDCKQNRTLSVNKCPSGFFDAGLHMCVTKINSANIAPYCKSNTGAILPHPTNCAWYYNCSVTGRTLQSVYPFDIEYVQECKYPDLFSSATMRCEHFQSVSCSGHFEPQAPCEYFKNRCDPSTSNCIPCPNRLPSCKGLPNGRQTITNLYDGLQYLADCSLNRTMSYKLCTPGSIECAAATTPTVTTQAPVTRPAMITFFPPIQTQATTVQPSICAQNFGRVIPNQQHCGQYYNCTKTSEPFLYECPYPQMFNEFIRRCQDFQFVSCNSRPEYKAPCEYQQNICSAGDLTCIECSHRLPSCRNLADGDHPFPGREGTSSYITCLKGRTMGVHQCSAGVFDVNTRSCSAPTTAMTTTVANKGSGDPSSYCRSHPYDMIEDPTNCAKYYNCRDIFSNTVITAKECPYPLLFHPNIRACADFSNVRCGQRYEPQAPCEYSENQCQSPSCVPCSQRFVSCVGLHDGHQPYPGQPSKYVRCQRNRTIAVEQCSFGVFDAASGQCRMAPATMATVLTTKPTTIDSYCQSNPQAVIPHPTNCAQYYMCNTVNTPLGNHLMECSYPQLFDQITLMCRDRTWVQCGQRRMPTSQCDYKLYQCIGFDCQRCPGQVTYTPPQTPRPTSPFIYTPAQTTVHSTPSTGPTCIGRPDGLNPYPGRELTAYYIVCDQGRLIETGICIINKILDPIRRRCTDPSDPDVIDAYCTANPGVTIPSVSNCAQFYDCGSDANGHRHELQECIYPQLYSTVDNTCKHFSQVQCGQRVEPVTPCEYHQYQCDSSDPNCIPCQQRMPSCQGKPDGLNAYPNSVGTANYIVCDTGRTVKIDKCTVGYFDPVYRQCRMVKRDLKKSL